MTFGIGIARTVRVLKQSRDKFKLSEKRLGGSDQTYCFIVVKE